MDLLAYIKGLVYEGQIIYSQKAVDEMNLDGLDEESVEESILRAQILRTKRSRSPRRAKTSEKIHIIEGLTRAGRAVYTKGVIRKLEGIDVFYILISAKRSVRE